MRIRHTALFGLAGILFFQPAYAWGPDGHRTVAALAARLIAGSRAAVEVKAILGGLSLADASVWADCVKGVDPDRGFRYENAGEHPECRVYETSAGEAAMADFVRRNFSNCHPRYAAGACHKAYHYADIDVRQHRYRRGLVGARADDVVGAIVAAAHKLRGDPVPTPFDFKDRREALMLLVHYVGDVHQPLHVGVVYLNGRGRRVHPDRTGFDRATDTHGGNDLLVGDDNLHALWDAVPPSLTMDHTSAAWVARARAVPPTAGGLYGWPRRWASDTLHNARRAFRGLRFGPRRDEHWTVRLPAGYAARMKTIKQTELTAGGAHLAELLEAIWP